MVDQTETPLAILFADVCGSTKLYDVLGDVKARETVARCIGIMTDATTRNRGRLIKTIGDEVMSTFPAADDAAQAAAEMQEDISQSLTVDGHIIMIRVGFHYGPALQDGIDVFGDAVNIAARMTGQAKAAQILTTSMTVKHLSSVWQASTRQIDRAALKGKRDEIGIFEVMWQREDVTRMATSMRYVTQPAEQKMRLVLQYKGKQVEVNERHPTVVMGRADQNDLVVQHGLASRLHARFEYRKGNFILTDQSINGTYVRAESGQEMFVRRDSMALQGEGLIGLGEAPKPGSPDAIRFACID